MSVTFKLPLCHFVHCVVRFFRLKDCVRVLLKYGSNVHVAMSPGKDKKTPIILAAAHGNLEMVKLLYEHGAFLEQQGTIHCMYFPLLNISV